MYRVYIFLEIKLEEFGSGVRLGIVEEGMRGEGYLVVLEYFLYLGLK